MQGKKMSEKTMGKCCTVGNTEIMDEAKRLVKCKVCGRKLILIFSIKFES